MPTRDPRHLRRWLIFGGIIVALVSLTAFLLLSGYVDDGRSGSPRGRTESRMAALGAAIESYRLDFDWPPSSFANTHIVAILSGTNPPGRVYCEFTRDMLSHQREILDQWNTPLSFAPSTDKFEAIYITSAGPDRTFDTKDDIRSY